MHANQVGAYVFLFKDTSGHCVLCGLRPAEVCIKIEGEDAWTQRLVVPACGKLDPTVEDLTEASNERDRDAKEVMDRIWAEYNSQSQDE